MNRLFQLVVFCLVGVNAYMKPCQPQAAADKINMLKHKVKSRITFVEETGRDKGFNTAIAWKSFAEGMALAKSTNTPALVLLHKSWCPSCAALKVQFNTSPSRFNLIKLSKKFVMINAEDDEYPQHNPAYAPDGDYIPRILFVQPDGTIRVDIVNPSMVKSQWMYYYPTADHVVAGMTNALAALQTAPAAPVAVAAK